MPSLAIGTEQNLCYIFHGTMNRQTGYSTYEQHYNHVKSLVVTNENKYSQTDVDNVDIDEDGPPQHLWSQIAAPNDKPELSH